MEWDMRPGPIENVNVAPRRLFLADGMIAVAATSATFAIAKITLPILGNLGRNYQTLVRTTPIKERYFWRILDASREMAMEAGYLILTVILLWLIAYAAMRLRRPGPPFRVAALRPGVAALWASGMALAAAILFRLALLRVEAGYLILTVILLWLIAYAAMRLRRPKVPFHTIVLRSGMAALWSSAMALAAALPFLLARDTRICGLEFADAARLTVASLAVPTAWGTLKVLGRWCPEANWLDRFGRILGLCWWLVSWLTTGFIIYLYVKWGPSPGGIAYF
jgi:hypothetical protein